MTVFRNMESVVATRHHAHGSDNFKAKSKGNIFDNLCMFLDSL